MKSSLNFRPNLESLESRLVPSAPAQVPASAPPPSSNPADYDLVLTNVCEDPVGIKILADGEKTKDFYDKAGDLTKSITTGTLKVQVVDLNTLDSLVLNISGPQTVSPDGTGVTRGSGPRPAPDPRPHAVHEYVVPGVAGSRRGRLRRPAHDVGLARAIRLGERRREEYP